MNWKKEEVGRGGVEEKRLVELATIHLQFERHSSRNFAELSWFVATKIISNSSFLYSRFIEDLRFVLSSEKQKGQAR